jgi:hypothetical protein
MNPLKRLQIFLVLGLSLISLLGSPVVVSAHRSGCHSWHSCPSDSGTYTCGDKGYCSGCPDNRYCKQGQYSPAPTPAPRNVAPTTPPVATVITGAPKTLAELYKCLVVGNKKTKIYHLKGSSYIRQMNIKDKECFVTEQNAKAKAYRKSLK